MLQVLTEENEVLRDRLRTSYYRLEYLQTLQARLRRRARVLAAESERLQGIKLPSSRYPTCRTGVPYQPLLKAVISKQRG